MTVDPDVAKACCVTSYSSDLVSLLLGESYHPGGLDLTRRLLTLLECTPGQRLLDVASGRGTTALVAAAEYGAQVEGLDLARANVALAAGAASARGLAERVRFRTGDAECLPFADASFDVVLCECALCTFPDKPTATRELARVVAPGGRVGITDITADRDRLPEELTSVAAWVACVADARPTAEYLDLLTDAGLVIRSSEDHRAAVERMVAQISARLDLLRMTSRARLEELGLDVDRARPVLEAARRAVEDGVVGYTLIVAEKPCA
jgi:ubiquinone/menaquinone biosynthesis C-methylase UbiE